MHNLPGDCMRLLNSDLFRLWFVNDNFIKNHYHGAHDLFADLPDTVHHEVLHAQVFGKRNIHDSRNHKKRKTCDDPTNKSPCKKIAHSFHDLRLIQEINSCSENEVGEGGK